jgi:hypothetical protein
MSSLTSAVIAALSAAVKDAAAKDAKADLPAGTVTTVDFTVRVQGTLAKAAEGQVVADTTSLPWTSVLALAIKRSGMHADVLRELCADVLAGNLTDAEKAAVAKGKTDWEVHSKPLLRTRTNEPAVKAALTVTVVE